MKNNDKIVYGVCKGNSSDPEIWSWKFCVECKIPFICVTLKTKYAHVTIDLEPVDEGLYFEDPNYISELFQEYYFNYCKMAGLPENKISFVGSYSNFGVTIFKKDYNDFAIGFYNFIQKVLSEHGKIDMYLKELNELYVEYNHSYGDKMHEVLNKIAEVKAKIWDENDNRLPVEEGRMFDYDDMVQPELYVKD